MSVGGMKDLNLELRNLHDGELEHLKTETRLKDEMFASEMGECVFLMW